ncbi:hypothetical protein J4231_01130 [Candidatus Woesearchaeota archaeon]|nr:hypothetical protein [Candidatus Woesearchaeota archaeon]
MKSAELSKRRHDKDESDDIYSSLDYIEELEENDEISLAEQGFMEGYIEA